MCDLHDHDGTALLEHSADRGHDPYPSIFNTAECNELLQYCSSHRCYVDQCMFGASFRKPTEIILPEKVDPDHNPFQDDITCCHRGGHQPLLGKDPKGSYRTTPAAQYPPRFSHALAYTLVHSISHWLLLRGKSNRPARPKSWESSLLPALWAASLSQPPQGGARRIQS